ncbi:MAG: MFS transporter [Candidatus Bathyarchaeota archaeon]|nr:MFS transporter [Candidatus Bathyarchaeota archaeon]
MGFVASASTIPGILISLPAASLSDIFGRRKVLLASSIVFASAPFLYLLINSWWQLILVRFYHGFATAVFVPVAEASVAEQFPAKRGERISLFSSVTAVGRAIAPFLGGYILFLTDFGYHTLYLVVGIAGVTALITALLFLAERKSSAIKPEGSKGTVLRMLHGWRSVAKNRGVQAVSFIQASQYYTYGAVEFFLVGYLIDIVQLDSLSFGTIMGSQIVAVILAKPYMGRISDKIGRRIPIVAGSLVSSLPLLAIPFVTQFPVLLPLSITYGLGFAMVTSSTPALVSELVPASFVGTAMGFLSTIMDVGQTLGPIVTGMLLATNMAYIGSFFALAAVLLVSCLIFVASRIA